MSDHTHDLLETTVLVTDVASSRELVTLGAALAGRVEVPPVNLLLDEIVELWVFVCEVWALVVAFKLLVSVRDVAETAALDSPWESACTVPRCDADAVLLGAAAEADEVKFGDDLVTADRDAEETVVDDNSELVPVLVMTEVAGERGLSPARFLLKSVAKMERPLDMK